MKNKINLDDLSTYPKIPFKSFDTVPEDMYFKKESVYDCLGLQPDKVNGAVVIVYAPSSVIGREDIRFFFFLSHSKVVVQRGFKCFKNSYSLHDFEGHISEFVWSTIKEYGDFPHNMKLFCHVNFDRDIDSI